MPNRNKNKNPIQKKLGKNNQNLPTVAQAGTVKGSKAAAFKQRQARKNNAENAPKAPVVDPLTEKEQKFADYAQLVEDEAVLKERKTELRTYFTNLVLAAEDDGEDKVYNEDETVYFSLKKVREFIFSDELQVKENQIATLKEDLKNKQKGEIINHIAKLKNIKRTLQYITPKKGGKK
tara:strand:+ start:204 stop:737 length:534 start_codon:yes stop_codon:yes gene_type:complete